MDYGKFAIHDTLYGLVKICYKEEKITFLKFVNETERSSFEQPCALTSQVKSELDEYFMGKRTQFDFPILLLGTDFQKKVWKALCEIPYGETRTYKQVAEAIGNPKASRAVGLANNKNPILIVIPCHRVVGTNGSLVGYASGIERKATFLQLEKIALF